MSLYKRAQQSPLQGSKSNQRYQHSRCVARFADWMVFSLHATGTFTAFIFFFFFLFTEIFFSPSVDPLQGFQIFSFGKKKKKKLKPNFFFFPLHVNVEFRQSCSQRFTLHHFSSTSRFQVIHSGWRRSLKDFHFNSPLWHNFLASTVDSTPPLLLSPLILFFSRLCFVVSPTSSALTHYVFAALAPPSGLILGFGINFSCYVTSCFSIKEPH